MHELQKLVSYFITNLQIKMILSGHEANYRAQRRELQKMMATFLHGSGSNEVTNLEEPVLPDCVDDPVRILSKDTGKPKVLLQCEDFGGNLTAPFYVGERPSVDYYASNLLLHVFVVANASDNINNVYLYDERGGGKGGNEVCSLRFVYHLERWVANRTAGTGMVDYTRHCILIHI